MSHRPPPRAPGGLRRFLDHTHNVGRGRVAQRAAEEHLRSEGYRIVAANWTSKAGEIDLIAYEGETLCFVEVKARSRPDHGPAVAAVDARKQHRLARAAALYLARSGYRGPCRFDVLGLDRRGTEWEVTLIRGAFEA